MPGLIIPRAQLEDDEEVEVFEDFSQYLPELSLVNPTTTTNPTIDENAVAETEQVTGMEQVEDPGTNTGTKFDENTFDPEESELKFYQASHPRLPTVGLE